MDSMRDERVICPAEASRSQWQVPAALLCFNFKNRGGRGETGWVWVGPWGGGFCLRHGACSSRFGRFLRPVFVNRAPRGLQFSECACRPNAMDETLTGGMVAIN